MLEKSLATLFALLILATLINRFLLWRLPERKGGEVTLRIRTWWGIVICFSMVISGPRWMTLTFFALISFLALKEYCTLISVHFPRWLYWGIPLNYLLIGFNCFELFLLFIPLAGFLILATGQVLVGDPSGFLHTVSAIFWGWIMTVFALSHAAWLLMLPTTNIQGGALLVLFLLALTESNDIAQYLWGKSCGRRKVVPKVSPGKTLEGLMGGVITIMIVLSEIGVNIAPLLAGAGALGLAISFGSQTLVKDIITGVFIQFENGMNTGDLVTIGPLTGTVERMSIRSVGVRQDTGAYHIIPWSSITTFANFVRGIGSVVANYDVDRHEDADKANQALKDAVAELMENEEIRGLIIGEPNFAGIVGLSNTAFTLRVSFTTLPLKQWTVRFALDSQVKKHFDLAGVRAPVQTYQVLPAPGATPAEPLPPGEPTL